MNFGGRKSLTILSEQKNFVGKQMWVTNNVIEIFEDMQQMKTPMLAGNVCDLLSDNSKFIIKNTP